jgi:hypothetical protein
MRPALTPRWNPAEDNAGSVWLVIVGRPKPGVPTERAQAEVDTMFRRALSAGTKPRSQPGDALAATLAPAQSGLCPPYCSNAAESRCRIKISPKILPSVSMK